MDASNSWSTRPVSSRLEGSNAFGSLLTAIGLAVLLLLLGVGAPASAADTGGETAAAQEAGPQAYLLAEVTLQSGETRRELEAISRRLEPNPVTEAIRRELTPRKRLIDSAANHTRRLLAAEVISDPALNDQGWEWTAREADLALWTEQVTQRSANIDREIARLGEIRDRWKATRVVAREANATAAVEGIDRALGALKKVEAKAQRRSKELHALQAQLQSAERVVATSLASVRDTLALRRGRLLEPDATPIWRGVPRTGELVSALSGIGAELQHEIDTLRTYVAMRGSRLVLLVVLISLSLLGAFVLRRGVEHWTEGEPALRDAARFLDRPIAIAVLLALIVSIFALAPAPRIVRSSMGLALLIPALRVLPLLMDRVFRPIVYALAAAYVFRVAENLVGANPALARLLFTLQVIGGIAFLLWLRRPARLALIEHPTRLHAWLGLGARALLAIFSAGLVLNLFGYFGFAAVLVQGAIISSFAGLLLYGAHRIAEITVALILRTPLARRLRTVRIGSPQIQGWATRIATLLALIGWAELTFRAFTIRDPLYAWVVGVVTAPIGVGAISLSLGDLLAFGLVIAASSLLARLVHFVLEDEVFPRVALQRGLPNAIATMATYAILLLGFVLALGAAGVELGRLTLLAGAFGVGIGFGLQDVVNNFVSGLILLFERPIQVGDTVELPGLLGDVRRIGPRSSTVHTFDGAEVIVPNGQLISDRVTNWTLSDRRRRVVVEAGVAYGTDPERVLEILREVAEENDIILKHPEPTPLFTGFGDSSLDFELRCWIPRYEEGLVTRSALWVAIHRKLREAGIEIPFPQRDLHLRSVNEEAAERLGRGRHPRESREPKLTE